MRPCIVFTWRTITAEVNHDVSLSVHDAFELERGDVTPDFEGPEESIVYDLLIQIGSVAQDSAEWTEKQFNTKQEKQTKQSGSDLCFPKGISVSFSPLEAKDDMNHLADKRFLKHQPQASSYHRVLLRNSQPS